MAARRGAPRGAVAWSLGPRRSASAEILFDVGNHILSAHFGVSATDYEDIIARLGSVGVIDPAFREELKGLGGFRNVLVHGYLRIDPERVTEHLGTAPVRFSRFARAVRDWLAQHAS